MPVVNFSVPLPTIFEGGSERAYKNMVADAAWEAAMAGPPDEHVLWPANGAKGTEVEIIITMHCEDMPFSKVEKETKLIVEGAGMSMWNKKYPPKKVTHVQIPWSKKGPGAEVKVIQWQGGSGGTNDSKK